ncbi:TatD family hydrolase, partial [bacterium]|nr:TatD family hydrolase [bacterium]
MIDTHCHLYWDSFQDDLPEVLRHAREAGVDRAITIAIDKPTALQCLELVGDYPEQLKCAIGVHPSETDKVTEDDLLWLEAMAGDPAVVAIGEIGLDIYRG